MISTKPTFDYEDKQWGAEPLTNFLTQFQGLELFFFLRDALHFLPSKKAKLLDLGCGGGNIAGFFKSRFSSWEVTGIDVSRKAIAAARISFPRAKFITSGAEKINQPSQSYDCITSFDTLEHFTQVEDVLKEVHRLLKNNGIFYIGVPLERQFPTIYWLLYNLGWRGKKHFSGHVNFFTDKSLQSLLTKHGFILVKKRFSFHLLFSLFDIGYYFLQSLSKKPFAFETTVWEMKPGFKQRLLMLFKQTISAIGFIESLIFWWFPGGKGHFVYIKKKDNDFFSDNPPYTLLEDLQKRYGFKKAIQPRDIFVQKYIKKYEIKKAKNILDFGCANGIWLERFLTDCPAKGTGVDIAQSLIKFASERKNKKGNYFCTKKEWKIPERSFDFCYSFDVFEHVSDKKKEIKHVYLSLKKGGKFLFYTLNPNNAFTFDWLFEKFGSDYLYARADHDKKLYYDPAEFIQDLNKAGFKKVRFILYDGPANLFWHTASYAVLGITEKICSRLKLKFLLPFFLQLNDVFLRLIYPFNLQLDKFFINLGYSNGYFVWGEK